MATPRSEDLRKRAVLVVVEEGLARREAARRFKVGDTGASLTPSHSRPPQRRRRYYISRHLTNGGAVDPQTDWRLPAEHLEQAVLTCVRTHLAKPGAEARMLTGTASASAIAHARAGLNTLQAADDAGLAALLARVIVAPGRLTIRLDVDSLTKATRGGVDSIAPRICVDRGALQDASTRR